MIMFYDSLGFRAHHLFFSLSPLPSLYPGPSIQAVYPLPAHMQKDILRAHVCHCHVEHMHPPSAAITVKVQSLLLLLLLSLLSVCAYVCLRMCVRFLLPATKHTLQRPECSAIFTSMLWFCCRMMPSTMMSQ